MVLDRQGRHKGICPDIRDWTLGFLADQGWALEIRCWSCKRVTQLAGQDLVERFGRTGAIGLIERRFSCSACGARIPAVSAIDPNVAR
jgi:hypothetical protein